MKSSAVLLIDLENFYCSREEYLVKNGLAPGYDKKSFAADLERLLMYAREMVQPLPFIVRRAYANFNVYRFDKGNSARQFYLRDIPDELMKQGVEPVQVFRLSQGGRGGGSKNAADMRMAMEATALLVSAAHVEHFVLVTGDADFIPVILELKRHGHAVSLIGVTNATNGLIQRFVDHFELFEDLVAAEEVETQSGHAPPATAELTEVATALRRLLGRTRPLRFAAVKPLLSKELNKPFDPLLFECDTTGEFLRRYAGRLGLEVRQQPHDWVVDLSSAAGWKVAPPPADLPHTPDLYRKLLGGGGPADSPVGPVKVPLVPWEAWAWVCDATFAALSPAAGGGPMPSPQLLGRLLQTAAGIGPDDRPRQVQRAYPFVRGALGPTGPDGAISLPEAIASAEQLRAAVLRYLVSVLAQRLREQHVAGRVRPDVFAATLEAGPAAEPVAAEVAAALAAPVAAEPEPATRPEPQPAPAGDESHTAAGYTKLLQAGGSKGCETEAMKVPPVPWPVVERICDAAFGLLAPRVGGRPMPWDDVQDRLVGAVADESTGDPDRHVRRVLGMLRTAELTAEQDDLLSLRDDIDTAEELRWRVLMFALSLLHYRLGERGIPGPIHPDRFAESLDAGPLTARITAEVASVIPQLDAEEPAPAEQPAAAEEPTPAPAEAAPEQTEAAPEQAEGDEDEVPIATAEAFEAEPEGATPSLLSGPLMLDPAVVADESEPEPEPESQPEPGPASGTVPDDDDEIDLGALRMPPGESPSAVIKLGTKKIVIEPILAGEWIAGTDGLPEAEPTDEANGEPAGRSDPPAPAPGSHPPTPPEFA
jgi:uncharacterized LabA/DUF88 family protein